MHVPREERVAAWFAAAEADVRAAEIVASEIAQVACFHAQQAAAKALKGLVTHLSGDAPQVHAIARLFLACGALGAMISDTARESGEALDKYYIATRYPDALDYVDATRAYKKRDATDAIEDARAVLAWARSFAM